MSITFSFPVGIQVGGYFKSDILLSRGCLERTLTQARKLDIFFRVRSSGGYESTDTTGKRTGAFGRLG